METSDLDIAAKHYAIGWQDCEQHQLDKQRDTSDEQAWFDCTHENASLGYDGRVSISFLENARWWQEFWKGISCLLAVALIGALLASYQQKAALRDKNDKIISLQQTLNHLGANAR